MRRKHHAGLPGRRAEAIDQTLRLRGESVEKSGRGNLFQGRQTGRHRDRIAGQGAGLIDRAERCQLVHDLGAAAEGANRQTAADDLAQGDEIGLHAKAAHRALRADAETGHHLVEDQHGAMLRAVLAQGFEEAGRRRHQIHVARHRLDDDTGDLAAALGEQALDLADVVVVEHEGVRGDVGRHPGRTRLAEGERAGTGLHQQTVGVAVITALELDQSVAPGVTASETNRAHGRLGAGRHQTHLVETG